MADKVKGARKFRKSLKAFGELTIKACEAALFAEANNIMTDSQPLVPVKTGTLKRSGFVSLPKRGRGGAFVNIGYGGAAWSYAMKVHESHPTKAKFLEDPVLAAMPGWEQNIAALVRAFIKAKRAPLRREFPDNPDHYLWSYGAKI